jgi:hypothetical protein
MKMEKKEQNDRNEFLENLKSKNKRKFIKSLVSALVLSSTILLGFVHTTPCKAMLDGTGTSVEADINNGGPISFEEALYIVSSGLKDSVGNVLAVNLSNSHSLVLVSQLQPGIFEFQDGKYILDQKKELFQKMRGVAKYCVPVTCGLTWITQLTSTDAPVSISDAILFLKKLKEAKDNVESTTSGFSETEALLQDESNRTICLKLLKGLSRYMECLSDIGIEHAVVPRPSEIDGTLKAGLKGCVTDNDGHYLVTNFLSVLSKDVSKKPDYSSFIDCDWRFSYCILRQLTQRLNRYLDVTALNG